MNNGSNGSATVSEMISVETSDQLASGSKTPNSDKTGDDKDKGKDKGKGKGKSSSKPKTPKLIIDAGSSNTKYYFQNDFGRFPSKFKKFDSGECPLNTAGVMTFENGWYAFGDFVDSYPMGKTEFGYENDNKIRSLPIWITAAIIDQEYYLESLIQKDKTNKMIEFNLDVTLLTLSAHRLDEIKVLVKELKFSYNGRKFKVFVKKIEALPEGFGAAKIALNELNPTLKPTGYKRTLRFCEFSIFDFGGGTATLTHYTYKGKLSAGHQEASAGCGLQVIKEIVAGKAPHMADTANKVKYFNPTVLEAIETAELNEDSSFKCEYIQGRETVQLGEVLFASLHIWATELQAVVNILQKIKLLTRRGHKVFLTGGGFEIPPIEKFVKDFIGHGEMIKTLNEPGQINVTGLK